MQQSEVKPVEVLVSSANNIQVGGTHYQAEYQHWDMAADVGMNPFDYQITKYISRWRKKNGLQDVEKSGHFCQKYIELMEESRYPFIINRADPAAATHYLKRYLDCNPDIQGRERQVVEMLVVSHTIETVKNCAAIIAAIATDERNRLVASEGH